jgi:FtsP/CotA-like multicopper oxidase with cupredoxin domain
LHQQGTPYYDGFASQNQCPIPAGQALKYQFQALESGTTFWHAHFADQNADGLFGPLVVEDAPGTFPFKYDEERVILLTDAWNKTSWELGATLASPADANGPHLDPTPDQGLACLYDNHGKASCSSDASGQGFELNFVKGKTYRLRIIAASNLVPFVFSIDGHEMTLVKSDLETLSGNTVVTRLPIAVCFHATDGPQN